MVLTTKHCYFSNLNFIPNHSHRDNNKTLNHHLMGRLAHLSLSASLTFLVPQIFHLHSVCKKKVVIFLDLTYLAENFHPANNVKAQSSDGSNYSTKSRGREARQGQQLLTQARGPTGSFWGPSAMSPKMSRAKMQLLNTLTAGSRVLQGTAC